MFRSIFKVLIPALVLAATPWIVKAQDYPLKQAVSIIVPFAAGSATDTIMRLMASELQKSTGGTFVVENRPGHVGIIGTEQAAKAPPNGYTLVVSSGAQHSLAQWLFKNVPYDAVNDFAHIGKIVEGGFMLVVNPALPVKNLQEFIAYAKANPGKLAYGYGTSSAQLGATLLNSMAKIDTLGVPYKGQPPALTDLIGGSLQFMIVDLVVGTPLVTSGQLRAIAVTPAARVAYAPTLPTIAESGFPDYDFSTWVGLAAPRATPRPIVERLNAEIRKILAKPEVRAKLEAMGMDLRPNSVAEQEAFVQATLVKFGRIVKDAGILPQ
ncbi:MAG: tripartite tricarboxylate transporter substrate binding protein [Burkholderiales bacterium]|nr:tripartite tricarboxylate transporter substrate binding protein [Burkholderiales bacterium]